MRFFWAKTGKLSAYYLRFDIKLKKSPSVFDLVTVNISKQSFFQHHVWPVYQGKSYLHGIALPDFYIVSSFFYKRSKQARVPTFVWLFRDVATSAKGPGCDEGTNLRWRDFAVVPLMPTRGLFPCRTVKYWSLRMWDWAGFVIRQLILNHRQKLRDLYFVWVNKRFRHTKNL